MITLYGHPLSGNAHRVAALLKLLDLDYENVVVDLQAGAHKEPDYLALNPLGQVPVLKDGDLVLRDSIAILVYLARQYDKQDTWLPRDPAEQALVQQWLSTAVNDVQNGPFVLRVIKVFGAPLDREVPLAKTQNLFGALFEPHLANRTWLVGDAPTIADLANYAYVARVTEGDFDLTPYPAIRRWLSKVESLENFAPMVHAADLLGNG